MRSCNSKDAHVNVLEQMAAVNLNGLTATDLIVDGNLHRFRPDWEPKANKKRAWYVLFDFRTDAGVDLISGAFGWFKGADSFYFSVDLKPGTTTLSTLDRARLNAQNVEQKRLANHQRELEAQRTAEKALSIWNACGTNGHSKYLQRKKIASVGTRFSRGSIVLPVMDFIGKLHGLQFIDSDGNKRFLTGTRKKGHFAPLGEVKEPTGYIGIAEGYATGVSCHMAKQWPVFVAFDAGNLEPVAVAVRGQYPQAKIIIFADDDVDNPENPGRSKATLAAAAVDGLVLFPSLNKESA